jgi:hypothetical protein
MVTSRLLRSSGSVMILPRGVPRSPRRAVRTIAGHPPAGATATTVVLLQRDHPGPPGRRQAH